MTTQWVRDHISHASQAFQEQRDRTALKCLLEVLSVYPSEASTLRIAGKVLKANMGATYQATSREPLRPTEIHDPRLNSLFCSCNTSGCGAEWISAKVLEPDHELTITNPMGGQCTKCGRYFCRAHFGAGGACPQCGLVLDHAPSPNGRSSPQTVRLNKPLVHVLVLMEGAAPSGSFVQGFFERLSPDVFEDSPTITFNPTGSNWPQAPVDLAWALLARHRAEYLNEDEYDVRTLDFSKIRTPTVILKVFANRPKIVDPTAPAQQTNIADAPALGQRTNTIDAPASAQKTNSGWLSKVRSLFATG